MAGRTLLRAFLAVAALAVCLAPALAVGQPAAPDEAKAKTEGTIVYYTSNRTTIAEKHAKGFEKKYGIKVQVFRSGSEKVIAKLEAEMQAGRVQADILNVSDPGYFFAQQAKGGLLPHVSKYAATIPDAFKDREGHWAASRLTAMVIAYNTKLVRADQAPRRWADLTDARWHGKLTIASPSYGGSSLNWAAGIVKLYGWKFFEDLAKSKPLLTEGHLPGMQLVASGERPVSGEMNDYDARAGIAKGQPVAVVLPEEGTFVIPTPIAILKTTTRPNAAKLFVDYLLSDEGQAVFVEDHTYSARTDIRPPQGAVPLKDLKVVGMDWSTVEKQSEEIKTKFASTVGK